MLDEFAVLADCGPATVQLRGGIYRVQPTQFLPQHAAAAHPVWIGALPSRRRCGAPHNGTALSSVLVRRQGGGAGAVETLIEQVRAYRQSLRPSILLPQRMPRGQVPAGCRSRWRDWA